MDGSLSIAGGRLYGYSPVIPTEATSDGAERRDLAVRAACLQAGIRTKCPLVKASGTDHRLLPQRSSA